MEEKAKEVTTIEEESRMYRIYEMKEGIQESLENIVKVAGQQAKLISIVDRKPEDKKEFADFTKSVNESIKDLYEQKDKLETKVAYLQTLIDIYEDRTTDDKTASALAADYIITQTLKALGM